MATADGRHWYPSGGQRAIVTGTVITLRRVPFYLKICATQL